MPRKPKPREHKLTYNDTGMYRVGKATVKRKGVVVARHDGETLIVLDKYGKYERVIKEKFNKWKNKKKQVEEQTGKEVEAEKIDEQVKREEILSPYWLKRLREITGVKDIPKPERDYGWKRSKYNDILKKNYQKIVKDDKLDDAMKAGIINNIY